MSLLGPLLALSIFAEEDPSGADHYFSGPNKQNLRTITSQIQQELEISRVSLHKLFHSILVNATSRNAALNYLSECMARNLKRQQLQVCDVLLVLIEKPIYLSIYNFFNSTLRSKLKFDYRLMKERLQEMALC